MNDKPGVKKIEVDCPYCNNIGPGHGKVYNGKTRREDNIRDIFRSESFEPEYKVMDVPDYDYCPFCDWGKTTPQNAGDALVALQERNKAKIQFNHLKSKYGFR